MSLSELKREDFLYQPYYCEENIWQLCQHAQFKNSHVIFIASKGDAFPMLNQRAMKNPAMPILWDYHVVLLADKNQLIDFDTTLPFVVDAETYLRQSFLDNTRLDTELKPWFRLVPVAEFVTSFCSDRSHMKTDAGWLASPPNWPPIGEGSNLFRFTDMDEHEFGKVLCYEQLLAW